MSLAFAMHVAYLEVRLIGRVLFHSEGLGVIKYLSYAL